MKFQIIKLFLQKQSKEIFETDISTFAYRKSIMVLNHDKGRCAVVIDRKKYTQKCVNVLHTDSTIQVDHDPTKTIEGKIQRSIGKIKKNVTKQGYSRLYPTGS